jgi:adenosylcobinamide-phosphate synthase
MGAVFYRMSEFVSRYWADRGAEELQRASPSLQHATSLAWMAIDWLPARLTALCFAVVGSFEEAIEGWRFHAQRFPNDNDGVILAATAGAINMRLGRSPKARSNPLTTQALATPLASDSNSGESPKCHLRSVVGYGVRWWSGCCWGLADPGALLG